MLKPISYLCFPCFNVPRVRNHPTAIIHHITNIPPNEDPAECFPLYVYRNKGSGTESDPFIIYRDSKLIGNKNLKHLRFICVSDTHNEIHKIRIPEGDVFVHCGDAVNHRTSSRDIIQFNEFVGHLPHRYKLFVSGNHCVCFNPQRPDETQKILSNMTYIQDELIDVEGVKIYGSPWRPKRGCFYRSEAFGYDRNRIRNDIWSQIPEDVDFLLTHGPPYSIRDYDRYMDERIGCPGLLDEVVTRVRPRIHLFGHMHLCRGASLYRSEDNRMLERKKFNGNGHDILFVNLAVQQGRRLAEPFIIDYYYNNTDSKK